MGQEIKTCTQDADEGPDTDSGYATCSSCGQIEPLAVDSCTRCWADRLNVIA